MAMRVALGVIGWLAFDTLREIYPELDDFIITHLTFPDEPEEDPPEPNLVPAPELQPQPELPPVLTYVKKHIIPLGVLLAVKLVTTRGKNETIVRP